MRHFVSQPSDPGSRGHAFGTWHRAEIQKTVKTYEQIFAAVALRAVPMEEVGEAAFAATSTFSPSLATEIEAMAEGARVPVGKLAALNARTEMLAACGAATPGECSTVVLLRAGGASPVSVQTWDWHADLADSWLIWTIQYPDGRVVHTLTEYGIVGKIGVNSDHRGLHVNILHHERDGERVGLPVHVLARAVLECPGSFTDALTLISSAPCSASSALTLVGYDGRESAVLSAEVSPLGPRYVRPDASGRLVRTNHFLDPALSAGDREWASGPDSYMRLDVLSRAVASLEHWDEQSVALAMASHFGGSGAVCSHPEPGAGIGERYATLATVSFDLDACGLRVRPGGPCEATEWWSSTTSAAAGGVPAGSPA